MNSQNITFDLQGNVVHSVQHEFSHGYDFTKNSNGGNFFYIGFRSGEKGELLYVDDLEKNEFTELLPYDETLVRYLHFGDLVNFAQNKYGTYFTRSFCDTIYELKQQSIVPKYYMDFGASSLPQDILYGNYSDVRDFMMTCLATDYAFRIIGFYELENYIMFGFHFRNKIWNALYDKQSDECVVISSYSDDIFGTGGEIESDFYLLPKGFDDNSLFIAIDAYQIEEFVLQHKNADNEESRQFSEQLESYRLNDLKSSDNPVILEVQLK